MVIQNISLYWVTEKATVTCILQTNEKTSTTSRSDFQHIYDYFWVLEE